MLGLSPEHQMVKHTLCVRGIDSVVLSQHVKNRFILPLYQHLITKAFTCTEKLKVLSFQSYQYSGWLHVFTDFTISTRVTPRCQSPLLRVLWYKDTHHKSIDQEK